MRGLICKRSTCLAEKQQHAPREIVVGRSAIELTDSVAYRRGRNRVAKGEGGYVEDVS